MIHISQRTINEYIPAMRSSSVSRCVAQVVVDQLLMCSIPSAQDVFNLLPNLNMEELSRAFSVKTNDMMLVIYMSALIRSVLALHNLIGVTAS